MPSLKEARSQNEPGANLCPLQLDHPTVRQSHCQAVGLSSVRGSHIDGCLVEFGRRCNSTAGFRLIGPAPTGPHLKEDFGPLSLALAPLMLRGARERTCDRGLLRRSSPSINPYANNLSRKATFFRFRNSGLSKQSFIQIARNTSHRRGCENFFWLWVRISILTTHSSRQVMSWATNQKGNIIPARWSTLGTARTKGRAGSEFCGYGLQP